MWTCPHCADENPDHVSFCRRCARHRSAAQPTPQETPPPVPPVNDLPPAGPEQAPSENEPLPNPTPRAWSPRRVYATTSLFEAELIRVALRDEDIQSVLENQGGAFYAIGLPTPACPLFIVVRDADAERSSQVIDLALETEISTDPESERLLQRIRKARNLEWSVLSIYLLMGLHVSLICWLVSRFGRPSGKPRLEPVPWPWKECWDSCVSHRCRCGRTLEFPYELQDAVVECPWCDGRSLPATEERKTCSQCGIAFTPSTKEAEVCPECGKRAIRIGCRKGLAAASLIAIVAIGGYAGYEWLRRVNEHGVEFTYQLLFDETFRGNREEAGRRALEVMTRRLKGGGWRVQGRLEPGDRVVLRIPAENDTEIALVKGLLRMGGSVRLYAVAGLALQEEFNRSGTVPEGYRAWKNKPSGQGSPDYAAWNGPKILLREPPIVQPGDFANADARQELSIGGSRWVTTFELDFESAQRFDEAAEALYRQNPPGMIAIMLDGQIRSIPVVRSPSFAGHGQISGATDETDARNLAIILKSGELPVPIGRMKDGALQPGEPETEKRYGP